MKLRWILATGTFTILVLVAIIYLRQNQFNLSISLGWVFPPVSLSDILLFLLLMVDALTIFIEYRERKRRRKHRHSLNLIKEGLGAVAVTGHVDYNEDVIVPSYAKWAESSSMFSRIVQHFKDNRYKMTWQAYENGKKYDENIINEIVKKIQQYRETVERKLTEAKIPIPISEKLIDHQTKHYVQKFVKHLIFKDIKHLIEHGKPYQTLRVYASAPPTFSYLNWGSTTFAIAEESSLKHLQNLLEKLENDETIILIIKAINSLEVQLKDNKELEQFNREREAIIRQITYGQKNLRGKCDLCP